MSRIDPSVYQAILKPQPHNKQEALEIVNEAAGKLARDVTRYIGGAHRSRMYEAIYASERRVYLANLESYSQAFNIDESDKTEINEHLQYVKAQLAKFKPRKIVAAPPRTPPLPVLQDPFEPEVATIHFATDIPPPPDDDLAPVETLQVSTQPALPAESTLLTPLEKANALIEKYYTQGLNAAANSPEKGIYCATWISMIICMSYPEAHEAKAKHIFEICNSHAFELWVPPPAETNTMAKLGLFSASCAERGEGGEATDPLYRTIAAEVGSVVDAYKASLPITEDPESKTAMPEASAAKKKKKKKKKPQAAPPQPMAPTPRPLLCLNTFIMATAVSCYREARQYHAEPEIQAIYHKVGYNLYALLPQCLEKQELEQKFTDIRTRNAASPLLPLEGKDGVYKLISLHQYCLKNSMAYRGFHYKMNADFIAVCLANFESILRITAITSSRA